MHSKKFLQLLTDLRDATAQSRIEWEDTADEDMFRTNLGPGMVRVSKSILSDDERPYYTVWLLDPEGRVVDEYEALGGEDFSTIAELYELARRSARNASELVEAMLATLGHKNMERPAPK
jgi:hypothetical protein